MEIPQENVKDEQTLIFFSSWTDIKPINMILVLLWFMIGPKVTILQGNDNSPSALQVCRNLKTWKIRIVNVNGFSLHQWNWRTKSKNISGSHCNMLSHSFLKTTQKFYASRYKVAGEMLSLISLFQTSKFHFNFLAFLRISIL